jgi:peptide/nickel transport system substrate-binding protein
MRPLTRRQFLVSTSAFALSAASGLPAPAAEQPQRGGTVTAIVNPEPVILTAALNTAVPTGVVSGNIFDGLVDYDHDLNPVPSLAERWETSADGLTFTLHLRKDVTWHDGKPFTSADVKWTLEEVWKKIHPRNQAIFSTVTTVETPDDWTVVLHLSAPSLAMLSSLNSNGAQVLPKHLYEGSNILDNPYNNKPVGTGPFVFKEWSRGNHIILERNPNYWRKELPYLDRVIFKIIPDAAARSASLEKGEIQYGVMSPIPLKDAERLSKLPNLRITTDGYEWISPFLFLDFNVERPYLKDRRVRVALAHAINRSLISKVVWLDFAKPADSLIPSTLGAFHDASGIGYAFDAKKATELLDEAGYKAGPDGTRFTLTIDFIPYGDDFKRTAEYLKQALKHVGIEATVRSQDTAAYTKRIYGDRDFDITVSWFNAFSDPQVGVNRAYWSGSIGKNIPWTNGSGYSNPELDALITSTQTEADAKKRILLFRDIQKIILTDLPSLPLLELKFFTVETSTLHHPAPGGDQVYRSFADYWLEQKKAN